MADAESERILNIDGTKYIIDKLSDEAKNILNKLSSISGDERRLSFELEKISLAKTGYATALKQVIERDEQGLQEKTEESEKGSSGGAAESDNS